jgi:hypothetical protein
MRNRFLRPIVSTGVLAIASPLLFAAPSLLETLNSDRQEPLALFIPVESRGGAPIIGNPTVIRQRLVRADFNILTPVRGQVVRLNLFDDVAYNVVFQRVETLSEETRQTTDRGGIARFGKVQGMDESEVYLATRGSLMSGNIRLPNGKLYQIRFVRDGIHVIREIELSPPPRP